MGVGKGLDSLQEERAGLCASEKQGVSFGRVTDPFLMAHRHPSPDHVGDAQDTLPRAS